MNGVQGAEGRGSNMNSVQGGAGCSGQGYKRAKFRVRGIPAVTLHIAPGTPVPLHPALCTLHA